MYINNIVKLKFILILFLLTQLFEHFPVPPEFNHNPATLQPCNLATLQPCNPATL